MNDQILIPEEFRLSVSKTKCFTQCKKQYEFSYILKMPKKDKDYHIFGKFCHKVLEEFHLSLMADKDQPLHILMSKCFKMAKEEFGHQMTQEMIKECFSILNGYLELTSKQRVNNELPNVLGCEQTFKVDIGNNVILNGAIDRVQVDSDGILSVIDYKTSKEKKYLEKDWFQLLTYAFVMYLEDNSIKKVRGSYVMLKHNCDMITKEFDIEEILTIKEKYLAYAQSMREEKEFKANISMLCLYCPFVEDICPDGKEFAERFKPSHGEVEW